MRGAGSANQVIRKAAALGAENSHFGGSLTRFSDE